jgi:hypothetical protein
METRELLTKYRYLCERFNRDDYPVYFQNYLNEITPYFVSMAEQYDADALCTATANAAAALLDEVADNAGRFRWKYKLLNCKQPIPRRNRLFVFLVLLLYYST